MEAVICRLEIDNAIYENGCCWQAKTRKGFRLLKGLGDKYGSPEYLKPRKAVEGFARPALLSSGLQVPAG